MDFRDIPQLKRTFDWNEHPPILEVRRQLGIVMNGLNSLVDVGDGRPSGPVREPCGLELLDLLGRFIVDAKCQQLPLCREEVEQRGHAQ